jgi:hypothetical protein
MTEHSLPEATIKWYANSLAKGCLWLRMYNSKPSIEKVCNTKIDSYIFLNTSETNELKQIFVALAMSCLITCF